jgi:hypothetical protein
MNVRVFLEKYGHFIVICKEMISKMWNASLFFLRNSLVNRSDVCAGGGFDRGFTIMQSDN